MVVHTLGSVAVDSRCKHMSSADLEELVQGRPSAYQFSEHIAVPIPCAVSH